MIDSNRCMCTHERSRHTQSRAVSVRVVHRAVPVGEKGGCCRDCDCDGFIRDPHAGWLPFARAAELVRDERNVASFSVRLNPGTTPREWLFTLRTTSDLDIAAPPGDSEREEIAELTGSRWLDHSQREAGKSTSHAAEAFDCTTCGAAVDKPCTPMHNGERGPGGWAHPSRGTSSCTTESAVIHWARRVKRGEIEHWPGLDMSIKSRRPGETDAQLRARIAGVDLVIVDDGAVRAAMSHVANEIVQLAHINECLMNIAAGARPDAFAAYQDPDIRSVLNWAYATTPDDEKTIDARNVGVLAAVIRKLDGELRQLNKEWKTETDKRARDAHRQGSPGAFQVFNAYLADRHDALNVGDEVEIHDDATVRRRRPGRARYGYVRAMLANGRIQVEVDIGAPDNPVADARQNCGGCHGTGYSHQLAPAWLDVTSNVMPCACAAGDVVSMRLRSGERISGLDVKRRYAARQQQPSPMHATAPPPPSDERSALQRTRDRMTQAMSIGKPSVVDRVLADRRASDDAKRRAAFKAVRAGTADVDQRQLVTNATVDCGCTWGAPCEAHGSYW